jgi:hypothetical protein
MPSRRSDVWRQQITDHGPHSSAVREQRGLRVVGKAKFLIRPFEGQRADRRAGGVIDSVKHIANG